MMWCKTSKKDFLRPYEEIKYFSRTSAKFKDSRPFLDCTNYDNFEQTRTVIVFGEHGIMAHIQRWLSQ